MTEVKTFQIEQEFSGTEDLYRYLLKNVEFIGKSIGVQIQKPLKDRPFCITGKEKITERNILFFASKSEFPESLGELITLAGAFDVDIIVFFMPNISRTYLEPINWLASHCCTNNELSRYQKQSREAIFHENKFSEKEGKICNDDTEIIVGEVNF